ncbi:jg980, partial [Pararge aegeria aegeria]
SAVAERQDACPLKPEREPRGARKTEPHSRIQTESLAASKLAPCARTPFDWLFVTTDQLGHHSLALPEDVRLPREDLKLV